MRKVVLTAKLEETLTSQPGAAEAGAAPLIGFGMSLQSVIRHLNVRRDAIFAHPINQGGVIGRIKARIQMDSHDFKVEGNYALPDEQTLKEHKAVHASGDCYADAATRPEHSGSLHGLAHAAHARFLSKVPFFPHRSLSSLRLSALWAGESCFLSD